MRALVKELPHDCASSVDRGRRWIRRAVVTDSKPEIANMPFEEALAELEQIVDRLEKGAVTLEESIVVPLDGD
jgi:Exonuclease VII small subunit